MKLCKDCKYCEIDYFGGYEFAECSYSKGRVYDRVIGTYVEKKQLWDYCSVLRGEWDYILCYLFGTCGSQGRFFESKEVSKE